jgi:HemY protein
MPAVAVASESVAAAATGGAAETPQPGGASVPPLFRPRRDIGRAPVAPAVIPIVRAPDDPGVEDDETDPAVYDAGEETAQAGGWRGFLSRVRR